MDWACLGEASADLTAMSLQAREGVLLKAMKDCISWAASWTGYPEDQIFLTSGATAACDVVLRLPRRESPRVLLTTNHAFASIADAVRRAGRAMGRAQGTLVRHEVVSIDQIAGLPPTDAARTVAASVVGLTLGAPALFVVEHITSSLGLRLPVEEIAEALRDSNCEVIVDAAQSVGVWRSAKPAQSSFACFHKYLNCPAGTGFGVVNAELHEFLPASTITLAKLAETMATQDPDQWIQCRDRLSSTQVSGNIPDQVLALRAILETKLRGFVSPAVASTNPSYRSHIVTLDAGESDRAQRLWEALGVSGFKTKLSGRHLRVSLHHSLTTKDVEAFSESFVRETERL